MTVQVSIRTPDATVFTGPADAVVAPGVDGEFGVLPRHAPLVAALQPGLLAIRHEGDSRWFVVGDSLLEVKAGTVTILADVAQVAADPADAEQKLQELRSGRGRR
jgi:F-type H+-transporting ATPase subunit epsilon